MTNFENKKDECMKILAGNMALVDGKPVLCAGTNCYNCDFYETESGCDEQALDWLLAEYQEPAPKLTKREREFLEKFDVTDKAIKRDRFLYLCCKTYKGELQLSIEEKLFPFIKQGETWTFADLLKLEGEE